MAYLKNKGKKLYYEHEGSNAPPLVFVHGFSCSHKDWKYQVEFFKTKYSVMACDQRGHGFSEPDPANSNIETFGSDINTLIDAIYNEPVVLVGHSMGCRVVLEAYRDQPQSVKGIVLIEGSRGLPPGDRSEAENLTVERIRRAGYHAFLVNFFEDMFFEGCDREMKEHIIMRALSFPEETGIPLFASTLGWDAGELVNALSNIKVPLLVLQSTFMTKERVRMGLQPGQTSSWIELIKKYVPLARIEIVSGAGHFPMLEKPDEVNRIVGEFIPEIQS